MSRFQPGFTAPKRTAIKILQSLGMTTGLKLCLDAGDINSYSGGQVWEDTSGNGLDFNRGDDSGSSTDDPTFNGIYNQVSENEFFSFDGGDYFREAAASPSWVHTLHKNNAIFAFSFWVNIASFSDYNDIFGNVPTDNNKSGVFAFVERTGSNPGKVTFEVFDGTSTALGLTSSAALSVGTWNFIGLRYDEASGAGHFQVDGTQDVISDTYSTPDTNDGDARLELGRYGPESNGDPIINGGKMAMVNFWQGTIPSAANLLDFYNQTKVRFGV